jgi:hypothetical protein
VPRNKVDEEEVEQLFRAKKIVPEEIAWDPPPRLNASRKFEVKAYLENQTPLVFSGVLNESGRYSLSLRYKKKIVIRRWDTYRRHTNPDGTWVHGVPHKHRCIGEDDDPAYAFEVNDVAVNDVNKAVQDFAKECNVELLQPYQDII